MADNIRRKCLKCGRSPKEDSDIQLYRFPKPGPRNMLRCESWARFCYSDDSEWHSVDFQEKIYAEHRMLCNRHFKDSAFVDFVKKKLNRHAVPDVQCVDYRGNCLLFRKLSTYWKKQPISQLALMGLEPTTFHCPGDALTTVSATELLQEASNLCNTSYVL